MPKYTYKGTILATGAEIDGVAEATDKFALAKNMKAEGKLLLTASEVTASGFNMDRINAFLTRVDLREKIVFARNLATMLEAGLPVSRALQIFLKQTQNPKFRIVLQSLVEDINKGVTVSDAMAKFKDIFPDVFVSMVRAGEESGGLVDALNVVGSQMEKTYTLKKKVRGAMIYPLVVLSVMIIVGILMMIYVVPGLKSTFLEMNVELPATTKVVIGISDFIREDFLLAILGAGILVVGFIMFQRSIVGARLLNLFALRVPIFGKLVREYNAAIVTRTLSSLITAGVDIVHALEITKDVSANMFYKETLELAKEGVQKGVPLSQVFIEHPNIYPVMVGDMMEVGEETGQLSSMLKKIAVFYEEEVDNATADMSKLIEPLLMVVIAAFVGLFAISMITPMYSLMDSI